MLTDTITGRPCYPMHSMQSFWKLFVFRTAYSVLLLDLKFTVTF